MFVADFSHGAIYDWFFCGKCTQVFVVINTPDSLIESSQNSHLFAIKDYSKSVILIKLRYVVATQSEFCYRVESKHFRVHLVT